MTINHTKGPWDFHGSRIVADWDSDGFTVIAELPMLWNRKTMRAQGEANARLIAAAPTMLDALIAADLAMAQGGILSCHATRKEIHAAIAKATGEQQ